MRLPSRQIGMSQTLNTPVTIAPMRADNTSFMDAPHFAQRVDYNNFEEKARPASLVGLYARARAARTEPSHGSLGPFGKRSLAQDGRNPSPGQSVPRPAKRRRYADAPAAALLTGLGAGERSPLNAPAHTPFSLL